MIEFLLQIGDIVSCLWSVLDDLDDLTSSTNNILELLSSILVHPKFNDTGYVCCLLYVTTCNWQSYIGSRISFP